MDRIIIRKSNGKVKGCDIDESRFGIKINRKRIVFTSNQKLSVFAD